VSRGPAVELDRRRAEQLFAELDGRLRRRGVAASLYVVGGIAIALTINDTRRTMDIDALASDERVMEEARALAGDEGLPANWLSQAVRPWVPPPPAQALEPSAEPGLSIHVAPPRHLLAMKLVANRRQDTDDILLLVDRLGCRKPRLKTSPACFATSAATTVYSLKCSAFPGARRRWPLRRRPLADGWFTG